MPTVTLNIKTKSADSQIYQLGHVGILKAVALIRGIVSGSDIGSIDTQVSSSNPVAASGTITITYASIVATDTVVIGNQTFTCVASGATGNQFNKVTDATATGDSLVTAINANTVVGKHVTALNAAGVVTITAKIKGSIGNQIVMSKTGTGIALVQLTGGTGGPEGTVHTFAR